MSATAEAVKTRLWDLYGVMIETPKLLHPTKAERSAGAWSWSARVLRADSQLQDIGSQFSMTELLRYKQWDIHKSNTCWMDLNIDPFGPRNLKEATRFILNFMNIKEWLKQQEKLIRSRGKYPREQIYEMLAFRFIEQMKKDNVFHLAEKGVKIIADGDDYTVSIKSAHEESNEKLYLWLIEFERPREPTLSIVK